MWKQLLAGTDWSMLRDFVSPALFDVVPARVIVGQGTQLIRWARDRDGARAARRQRAETLEAVGSDLELVSRSGFAPGDAPDPSARGAALLRLYFHQLYAGGPVLLDLRTRAFTDGASLRWAPGSAHAHFQPGFASAIRDLYDGFYDEDDARFRTGLDALGVRPAEETFRTHFGADDPHAVHFELDRFVGTFHEVFVRCREAGSSLHPQLLPFGVYLAALYEHLAALGGAHDVLGAFHAARGAVRDGA